MTTWLRAPAAPTAEGPFTELDARRLGPVRRFFVRHPIVMDVVVAVIFAVPAFIEPLGKVLRGDRDFTATALAGAVALIVIGGLVLLRRRTEPVLTAIAIQALYTASFAVVGFTNGFEVGFAFAMYAVAAHRRVWLAWTVLLASLAVSGVTAQLLLGDAAIEGSGVPRQIVVVGLVVYQAILGLIALVIGVSVRARRQHIDDLIVRANAMARDRDQQAELAVADERTRIARELHDVVAHSLTVMVALADGARASAATDPVASARALDALTDIGRSALSDMRSVLGVLREPDATVPLEPEPDVGLDELVDRFRAAGLPVRVVRTGTFDDLDVSVRRAVWRIVQESLTNVLRYAPHSTQVVVELTRHEAGAHPAWFAVQVTNRGGRPADAAAAVPAGTGRGIVGMRERALAHGGILTAGPTPDGWQVAASLRLDRPTEETP